MNSENDVLISICIPIYNNLECFKVSFLNNFKIVNKYNNVELIISDNSSKDDIKGFLKEIKDIHPKNKIRYFCNEENLGLAKNFLKSVDYASGEYVWIIGSDDFLEPDSIDQLTNILLKYNNQDMGILVTKLFHLDLSTVMFDTSNYLNNRELIDYHKKTNHYNINSGLYKNPSKLVNYKLGNVMLGAMMAVIFKKSKWDSFEKDNMDISKNMDSLQSFYPHLFIFSKTMFDSKAYYFSKPLIVVGDGKRAWISEKEDFWQTKLPFVYLNIFNEILELYKGLLEDSDHKYLKRNLAKQMGSLLPKYLIHKYLFKKIIFNSEEINTLKIALKYSKNFYFYLYLFRINKFVKFFSIIYNKISKKNYIFGF